MAKLPDSNIVPFPSPGSRRPASTIDVSGYARGAAAIGTGTEALGKGITSAAKDVAAVLQKQAEADDRLELARANGYLNTALLNQANAARNATKADGLVETTTTKLGEAIETAAKSISSPRARESFTRDAQENAASLIGVIKRKAFNLVRDAGLATDIDTMNKLRESAIAGGPEAATVFVDTIHGYIDAWQTKGWIDTAKAANLKKFQAEGFVRGKLATLTPAERLEALQGRAGSRYSVLADVLPVKVREAMLIHAERAQAQAAAAPEDTSDEPLDRVLQPDVMK